MFTTIHPLLSQLNPVHIFTLYFNINFQISFLYTCKVKVKVSPTTGRRDGQIKVPDFLTFGTTRVVGRQPHAPAAFTPRGIPGTHFLEAELTPGHMVLSVTTRKILVTDATGIRSRDRLTSITVP